MRRPIRIDNEYNEYVKDFYRKIEDYDWNDVTDKFRGLESILHRTREKQVVKLVKEFGKGENYVDIGCGTGLILRHLPEGSTGIDINPRHVERAKKYVPKANLIVGDVEKLPFPDETFDAAICTEVLEHLVAPETTLHQIGKLLKPNGLLIGSTPGRSFIWRLRFLSSTHYHNEPFHNEFTKSELQKMFAGWEILHLKGQYWNSSFYFVLRKK